MDDDEIGRRMNAQWGRVDGDDPMLGAAGEDVDDLDHFDNVVKLHSPSAMMWQDRAETGQFRPMDWGALSGRVPPDRPWIVPDWLPARAVTLLAGSGGTGKSLLVQQWLTAIATGKPLLGIQAAEPVPVLYVNCEDDHDELWRRQWAICRASGVAMHQLGEAGVHVLPRMGKDNALGTFDDAGRFVPGELLQHVRSYALAHGVRLIALDNLAHLFPGNENDRGLVTAFCSALAGLALEVDGAVVVVGHPAKKEESTYSGSTAWEAGVRQRLYLSRERDGEGNEVDGSDLRTLSIGKANYTGKGQAVEMLWRAGAFHPAERGDTPAGESMAEAAFLRCLDDATAQRRNVSDKPSPAYAPKVFATMPAGKRIGQRGMERAMQRLFDRGVIVANSYLWRDEKSRPKSGIKRADNVPNPPPEPVPHTVPNVPNPCPEPSPTHPYNTTYYGAGPGVPPPPLDNADDGDVVDW